MTDDGECLTSDPPLSSDIRHPISDIPPPPTLPLDRDGRRRDIPVLSMTASDIFQRLSPDLAEQVLSYLQTADKPTYKVAIQTLATQRKLRPVFVERKPRQERHAWMQAALGRPYSEQIAINLLQMWLMGAQSSLLRDFLDSLGIEHDEQGGIENLPPCPPPEKLREAVDALLAKYPAEIVAVYLNCFQGMDMAGWPPLGEILATDERLRLPSTQPTPTSAPAAQ